MASPRTSRVKMAQRLKHVVSPKLYHYLLKILIGKPLKHQISGIKNNILPNTQGQVDKKTANNIRPAIHYISVNGIEPSQHFQSPDPLM